MVKQFSKYTYHSKPYPSIVNKHNWSIGNFFTFLLLSVVSFGKKKCKKVPGQGGFEPQAPSTWVQCLTNYTTGTEVCKKNIFRLVYFLVNWHDFPLVSRSWDFFLSFSLLSVNMFNKFLSFLVLIGLSGAHIQKPFYAPPNNTQEWKRDEKIPALAHKREVMSIYKKIN